jgi:hypothetical protein
VPSPGCPSGLERSEPSQPHSAVLGELPTFVKLALPPSRVIPEAGEPDSRVADPEQEEEGVLPARPLDLDRTELIFDCRFQIAGSAGTPALLDYQGRHGGRIHREWRSHTDQRPDPPGLGPSHQD